MKVIVLDGYIDEPTCLGVPYYLSTYVRYVAGAAKLAGANEILYFTIDQLRDSDFQLPQFDYFILITGNPVPGKYLGGLPIKTHEIELLADRFPNYTLFVGGPIRNDPINFEHNNIYVIKDDVEEFTYRLLSGKSTQNSIRNIDSLNAYALAGTFIVKQHPRYPDLMAEIETGRGCPRKTHCSFCVEGQYDIDFRKPEAVIEEVYSLAQYKITSFRISKQADLYAYGSHREIFRKGFPKPEPQQILRLYAGIRDRVDTIQVLHLDNVNPGTIANYPDESEEITRIISRYNTPGDVMAFGMESADPEVIRKNFLKASPNEILYAIRMVNEIGGTRVNGIPKLLPGINLIRGLIGESRQTFELNYLFLKRVFEENLLLRRINIRQLKLSKDTFIFNHQKQNPKFEKKLNASFRKYREQIRQEIDRPMLSRVFPVGTKITDVIVEQHRGDWSLARNIASYPLVINIPRKLTIHGRYKIFITGFRERSVVGLTIPQSYDKISVSELKVIPGLSKRAGKIFAEKIVSPDSLASSPVFPLIEKYFI